MQHIALVVTVLERGKARNRRRKGEEDPAEHASAQGWRASNLAARTGTLPGSLRNASRIVLVEARGRDRRHSMAVETVIMANSPSGTKFPLAFSPLLSVSLHWNLGETLRQPTGDQRQPIPRRPHPMPGAGSRSSWKTPPAMTSSSTIQPANARFATASAPGPGRARRRTRRRRRSERPRRHDLHQPGDLGRIGEIDPRRGRKIIWPTASTRNTHKMRRPRRDHAKNDFIQAPPRSNPLVIDPFSQPITPHSLFLSICSASLSAVGKSPLRAERGAKPGGIDGPSSARRRSSPRIAMKW